MKRFYRNMGLLFLILLFGLTVLTVLLPKETYSRTEKRNLKQLGELNMETFTDGSFMNNTEDWISDHFPGRNLLMKLKTGFLELSGRKESQGVFRMKSGNLCERFTRPSGEETFEILSSLNAFADRYPDSAFYFCLVPNAVSVYSELLPANAVTDDQNLYLDMLYTGLTSYRTVDLRPAFSAAKITSSLYYRTDHHWTTRGAYEGYQVLKEAMGLSSPCSFRFSNVCSSFVGSLPSESGFTPKIADTVEIAFPNMQTSPEGTESTYDPELYTVTYSSENRRTASCYELSALQGDDPYQVFFGGNHPLMKIDTAADTGRRLLVIKDSYANALLPFLIPSFSEITVVDPRYYYDDIDALAAGSRFTDVLFLYNVNTFSQDTSLKTVLKNEQ